MQHTAICASQTPHTSIRLAMRLRSIFKYQRMPTWRNSRIYLPTPTMEIDTPIRSYLTNTLLGPVPSQCQPRAAEPSTGKHTPRLGHTVPRARERGWPLALEESFRDPLQDHARIIPRPRGRRDCNQSSRAACRSLRDVWQPPRWLSVLSCGSVCRSCVTVIARLASTHTALVSQSLVGLCFAFPSINQCRCVLSSA